MEMATILIVDDAKFMRTLMKDALCRGHEVIGSLRTAIRLWKCTGNLNPISNDDITMREKTLAAEESDIRSSARIIMVTALVRRIFDPRD